MRNHQFSCTHEGSEKTSSGKKMRSLVILLLFGISIPHWTTAVSLYVGDYVVNIDNQTLKSVRKIVDNTSPYIDLSGMELKYFEKNVFDDLVNITRLYLSNNRIKILPPKIFSKLHKLEELSLASNQLANVTGLFIGLRKLKNLDLSNNDLSKLYEGDLYGLTEFTNIIIKENKLESISSLVFQPPSDDLFADSSNNNGYFPYKTDRNSPSVPADFKVKVICRHPNSSLVSYHRTVVSIELSNETKELSYDCMLSEKFLNPDNHNLKFLFFYTHFERGWYKLPADTIQKISIDTSDFAEITPWLLNDLPSGVSSFEISNTKLTQIRSNVIKNPYVRELILKSNHIGSIDADALKDIDLTVLNAAGNALEDLDFIRPLKNLEYLSMNLNNLKRITRDTFRGLTKLQVIDLNINDIDSIEPGAFEDQTNLLEIRLEHNHITELDSRVFKGLKKLKLLKLVDNGLTKISHDTFSELRSLQDLEIRLQSNVIEDIGNGSFSNLNCRLIDLTWNDINDESIENGAFTDLHVQKLLLAHNYITELDSNVFGGILGSYELDLGQNHIKHIKHGDAEHLGNVRRLVLDLNPIERLNNGALYGLSRDNDVEISLHQTSLKVIEGGLFQKRRYLNIEL